MFRPTVKQRRTPSESPSKSGPPSFAPPHPNGASNTMPPPPSLPPRLGTPVSLLSSEQLDADDSQTGRSSIEPQRAVPSIVSTRVSTPITVGFSRKPATPISIGSRSSSIFTLSHTPTPISVPSRAIDMHVPAESHSLTLLQSQTTNNSLTQSLRTPPPEYSSPSTPLKKRPASAVESESSPASPSKRARRSRRPAFGESSPKRKVSRKSSATEPERSLGSVLEQDEGTETGTPNPARRPRRQKRSPVPYDPDQPGVELDPTVVTMASICVDTGQGRVSSKASEVMKNHSAWKVANRERRAQMVAEMEAKKYGKALNSETALNPTPSTPINSPPPSAAPNEPVPSNEPASRENDFDYSQTMSASKFNVQVRIAPNGETVVDEESLYVDNSAEQETHDYTHVEESDTTKFVNSATHSKKLRGSRWSTMETELFYHVGSISMLRFKYNTESFDQALSQFGENYELISYVLPGRDRKACKNKFKAEDKRNPERINQCLKDRVPYGMWSRTLRSSGVC